MSSAMAKQFVNLLTGQQQAILYCRLCRCKSIVGRYSCWAAPNQRLYQSCMICRAGDVVVHLLSALLVAGFIIRVFIGCMRFCKSKGRRLGCGDCHKVSLLLDCTISAVMILSKFSFCIVKPCVCMWSFFCPKVLMLLMALCMRWPHFVACMFLVANLVWNMSRCRMDTCNVAASRGALMWMSF